ncbi:MAG: metabolite traffic protein EboE [Balneolaceae bacterium]
MQLKSLPGCHLTYCSNIHPGEDWADHFEQLKKYLPRIRDRISGGSPFGVGLRLSAAAASQLLLPDNLEKFRLWLDSESLYVFTINGFPYGNFHGKRVKDGVYAPDWQDEKRLLYTLDLVTILDQLLPPGVDGGISTSPVSYKYWMNTSSDVEKVFRLSSRQMARAAYEMAMTEKKSGKEIHLDIEPEPDCLLENSRETVDFFTNRLIPDGVDFLKKMYNVQEGAAREILKRHIRVCYDTCHFAVEFEQAFEATERFRKAGIRIGKIQISSALKILFDDVKDQRKRLAERLKAFVEPTYLHQVVERRSDGSYRQYRDLDTALLNIGDTDAREWRVHFHVPVFLDRFEELHSTRDHISSALRSILSSSDCRHLEIETYTWDVLPAPLKSNLADSIERELSWTLELTESLSR